MEHLQNAAYYHARQSCYTCLNPNDVVDTSVQIEGEGVLCLCRNCIGTLALAAGFILSDNAEELALLHTALDIERAARIAAERELELIGDYAAKVKGAAKARAAR